VKKKGEECESFSVGWERKGKKLAEDIVVVCGSVLPHLNKQENPIYRAIKIAKIDGGEDSRENWGERGRAKSLKWLCHT